MSKANCACNTQTFYIDMRCSSHSTSGYPEYKVAATTIDRVKVNKLISASDVNIIKNKVRALTDKYNNNSTFVSSRGGLVPKRVPTDLTANSSNIDDKTFNDIQTMMYNMGGEKVSQYFNSTIVDDVEKKKGDVISATEEWSELISSFNNLCSNCVCNTDCSCNTVCSVVSDCGCNYS